MFQPRLPLLAAAALLAALPCSATVERTVEKTFTVSGAGTLRLDTGGGSLTVTPGPEGSVKIIAKEHIRADSDAEADELLKDLELTFEQKGNDVRAAAKYNRSPAFRFKSWPPVGVEFVATVPASYAADVHTSGGNVTIGDLTGAVVARTSGGSMNLGHLGGKVDARTSGGNIKLEDCGGPVTLETSGGSISAGHIKAAAELSTSGGNIRVDSVEGSLRAHTGGGGIRAAIVGPLKDACELSTSGGNVQVGVDKSAAFHLDASTSGGRVEAAGLTITLQGGKLSRDHIVGDVNGGGPVLKLRTSGGNITIEPR